MSIILDGTLGITQSVTGAETIPVGTTAQRPVSPVAGMARFNTSVVAYEFYNGTTWQSVIANLTYSSSYLVVAGGGSGGASTYAINIGGGGGGGGAGGLLTGTTTLSSGITYSFVIGAGGAAVGAGQNNTYVNGNVGNNSTAFSLTAISGGYGAQSSNTGGSGGSGGGGGWYAGAGGAGTSGQGNSGGNGQGNVSPYNSGSGGYLTQLLVRLCFMRGVVVLQIWLVLSELGAMVVAVKVVVVELLLQERQILVAVVAVVDMGLSILGLVAQE